ncbi:unnamed protein product [Brassicogethes aeneus]|uniref:Cytochrome P450 n=1 Tax=Brassicogethes aeneus TaxID=1431903 RepID=A0A9P0FKM1_BRAAE|nr:unnamed protein product [Brassicogethes aeneus]
MIELVLLAATILLVLMVENKRREKTYKFFYKLPYPFWIPIIGNSYIFVKRNILKVLQKTYKIYGDSYILYIPHRTYFSSIPEEIKIILNNPHCLNKSKEYHHLEIILPNTVFLVKAQRWRKLRKILSKSFKPSILDLFTDTFYEKSCVLVDILKKDNEQDICYLFQKLTLDNFSEATLGVKSTILQDEKEHIFVTGVKEIQRLAFNRIGNLIKMNDFLFSCMRDCKDIKYYINALYRHISKIMAEKRVLMANENDAMLNTSKLPILDLLLQVSEKEELTNEYIEEEMVLFAAAATDTTAYSMAFTCFMLALHPEIQEKVYQEVMSVCGNQEIETSNLNDLKYTEMVISEAQRLFPVIPMIGRTNTVDIDLGDKIIPANTNITLNYMALHRNPKYYTDPLVFNPNRFLPEEIAKRPPYTFLPFSAGPRNCIGMKYALMVMKTSIANIVRHFYLTTSHKSFEEIDVESSAVLMPITPLDIKYTEREIN